MRITRKEFGQKMKLQLHPSVSPIVIADWALQYWMQNVIENRGELEHGIEDVLSKLQIMEMGREYIVEYDELLQIANNLCGDEM